MVEFDVIVSDVKLCFVSDLHGEKRRGQLLKSTFKRKSVCQETWNGRSHSKR